MIDRKMLIEAVARGIYPRGVRGNSLPSRWPGALEDAALAVRTVLDELTRQGVDLGGWRTMDTAPDRFLFLTPSGFVGIGQRDVIGDFVAENWNGRPSEKPIGWRPIPR